MGLGQRPRRRAGAVIHQRAGSPNSGQRSGESPESTQNGRCVEAVQARLTWHSVSLPGEAGKGESRLGPGVFSLFLCQSVSRVLAPVEAEAEAAGADMRRSPGSPSHPGRSASPEVVAAEVAAAAVAAAAEAEARRS